MHLPASCAQKRDHKHSSKCCPAATLCSPKRPSKPRSKYNPRTEYQDAYKAYSPDTIRRIYLENRKAMRKNQKRNIEGTKETPRDLVPIAPKHRVEKPRSLPTHALPLKRHHEHKVPSPEPQKPSPVSSPSFCVPRCSSAPCRHPRTISESNILLPRFHWCSNLACHPATPRAVPTRKTWLT
ncbi:hypothetical protein E2C01_059342 [Portunus trituberculatus]|uniref:Uncharacterized protein n=1 Tax=Portunus trituberculatus TaxID=210409 RepID=A0A5B7GYV7_PORTR|nr:hypothetical protein [Portunus trituberculatus]